MSPDQYFRIRQPDVIYEPFDDEVVLINLGNGNYYSIQGVAAEIWSLIETGTSLNGIVKRVRDRYDGAEDEIVQAIRAFLTELSQEGLLEAVEPKAEQVDKRLDENVPTEKPAERPPFATPALNRYTDMQKLLLLDPIHDVGEQGWPQPKPDTAPESE